MFKDRDRHISINVLYVEAKKYMIIKIQIVCGDSSCRVLEQCCDFGVFLWISG